MSDEQTLGRTKKGRPRKPGRSVRLTIRLREGEPGADAILQRLARLPKGQRSAYIRRVLAGAPPEVLDEAFAQESAELGTALDEMWAEDWEDDLE